MLSKCHAIRCKIVDVVEPLTKNKVFAPVAMLIGNKGDFSVCNQRFGTVPTEFNIAKGRHGGGAQC